MTMTVYTPRKIAPRLSLILCAGLLSACASFEALSPIGGNKTSPIEQSEAYVTEFPEVSLNQIAQNVTKDIFKSGDIADVQVYNVEALTNTYVVDRGGDINFPLIGSLKVAGLTTTQLQQTLTQRYGADYLRAPSINVKLEAQDLGRVVVDGAVNTPGVFEINDIITLSEAIALAQGLDDQTTNGSRVYIVRNIEGTRRVKEVDMRQVRQLGAADPQIIPSDVIFVEDSVGRIAFREFLRTVPLLNTAIIYGRR